MQLVKLLVRGLGAALSDSRNQRITVCGDQDQSIYGFLDGGDSNLKTQKRSTARTNFDEFLDYWPGATVVKLQRNYRSTGNLVRAGSCLISKNGVSATSCSCETANADGPKLVVINASSEDREVQVHGLKIFIFGEFFVSSCAHMT
jgi:DNA helicase-2/ATP-dependent DNA helicase PcrA